MRSVRSATFAIPARRQHRHANAHRGKEIDNITHKIDMQLGTARYKDIEASSNEVTVHKLPI
jgi:hypothetical protein